MKQNLIVGGDTKNRNVSYFTLGKTVKDCLKWKEDVDAKFSNLSELEKANIFGFIIQYISLLVQNKNAPLSEMWRIVNALAYELEIINPLGFHTRWKREKYLGIDHIANLTYLNLIKHFSLEKHFSKAQLDIVFDEEIYFRQIRLQGYFDTLQKKLSNKDESEAIEYIETLLKEKRFSELRMAIEELEERVSMDETLLQKRLMADDDEDQVNGIFNAVVSTFSSLTKIPQNAMRS